MYLHSKQYFLCLAKHSVHDAEILLISSKTVNCLSNGIRCYSDQNCTQNSARGWRGSRGSGGPGGRRVKGVGGLRAV